MSADSKEGRRVTISMSPTPTFTLSVRIACSRICCLDNMSAEHKLVDQM